MDILSCDSFTKLTDMLLYAENLQNILMQIVLEFTVSCSPTCVCLCTFCYEHLACRPKDSFIVAAFG